MGTTSRSVAASFDGTAWTCFSVHALPDRHWGVLRSTTSTPDLELLVGLNSYTDARSCAAAFGRDGFTGPADGGRRRPHHPVPVPFRDEVQISLDTGGDPARVGPIIATRLP
jgi:hypothetical protein